MSLILSPHRFAAPYLTTASDYGGSTRQNSAGLTGVAASKKFVASAWFRKDAGDGLVQALLTQGTNNGAGDHKFDILINNSLNQIRVVAKNAAGSSILIKTTSTAYLAGSGWHHILVSVDLAAAAWLRVDGTLVALSQDIRTDDTIDFKPSGPWQLSDFGNGSAFFDGCLSEVFFHEGIFLADTSANNLKFRTAAGKPADLGADGSLPLGVQPRIYGPTGDLSGAGNKGTGGAFGTQGPAPTLCSSSPSD